ncbi:CPBP family intramembrane glutamic endopeptidase [Streptococcus halichoeri]|uniref:CPBP family intramembrane glutamic endopeptidase n=1 Tax=Streptococcus halichoeri TaxID=254785 RepID=UPI00135BA04A|nr:CPBP family intramembrane glutamic endopeptidase [Streptococcus halichoeri]
MKTVFTKIKWLLLALAILVAEQAPLLLVRKDQPFWQTELIALLLLSIAAAIAYLAYRLGFFKTLKSDAVDVTILWLGFGFVALTVIKMLGGLVLVLEKGSQANTANQMALEQAGLPPLLLIALAVVVAPIVEETIFRGLLFGKLFGPKSIWGLVFSSLAFGLLHMTTDLTSLGSWIVYGGMGLVLGFIYYKTEKLHYSILLHFLNNGISVLFMLFLPQLQ